MVVYIFTKFHENILAGFKAIEQTQFSYEKFQMAIIPPKNLGGVSVLILCTSSDDDSYLYQDS